MQLDETNSISVEKAESEGIDFSLIGVCRKLRKLAKLERIRLDTAEHGSGFNAHLLKYMEYCGCDVFEYIKDYLQNLQPYMLTGDKGQEKEETLYCMPDGRYRISVCIKEKSTLYDEVVVAFHEGSRQGSAKDSSALEKNKNVNELVPVFPDCITSHVAGTSNYTVKLFVQRGLLNLPVELPAVLCENGLALIRLNTVEVKIMEWCNQYIRDLYTSELEIDRGNVSVFTVLQQIPFTAYGRGVASNLFFLVDSLTLQKDRISRKAADFALVTYCMHLFLDESAKRELIELLRERYGVGCIEQADVIINRIADVIMQ